MSQCDNCRQPTSAPANLEGEVLCSDQCQQEYGITSLLSLMFAPLPEVPKGTKVSCFDPTTGRTEIVEA